MNGLVALGLRLSIVTWLWGLAVLLHDTLRVPLLGKARMPAKPPSVSVVLPARNEERNVEACLRSLLAQDYPSLQVIVVDDRSEDRTADLARAVAAGHGRVRVLTGEPVPPGWIGKSWANHQGVREATGEWLLFVDADARLRPDAVAQAVAVALERGADMLTLLPYLECCTFWERVLQPAFATIIAMTQPAMLINSRRTPVALANGQFILVRRDAYEAIGGHAAIRGSIVDDMSLAARAKRHGCRLLVANGTQVLSVRMYDGLPELWAGWRKSLYAASGANPLVGAAFLLGLLLSVLPLGVLAGALLGRRGPLARPALLATALMLGVRVGSSKLTGQPPLSALLQPLAAVMTGAIYIASAWRHYSGKGQEWKGRTYR